MRHDLETSASAVHLLVTAHGWACVQRVVVLLTARAYVVDSFEATRSTCPPYWRVGLTLRCHPAELELLQARLQRIPAVAAVVVTGAAPDLA